MKKIVFIFIVILFLGGFLRFYRLGEMPVGFHRDEAFLGYNAYSILKTGKDMSGNLFPLHLASFLYSPAGYSYLSIPFIAIYGLNSFSVRFASALFGSLTILTTFLLTIWLFKRHSYRYQISLVSSFLLAISPWHINLSRTATENTVVVFFITLGILFYLFWLQKAKWYLLLLAFFSFSLTLFVYQAPRAFLPFFIPMLIVVYGKKINNKKIFFISSMLFALLIIIPILFILFSKNLNLRIRTVSAFATSETQLVLEEQIRKDGVTQTPLVLTRIFHNKIIGYSTQVMANYFKHFTFDFLFTDQGFPERYKVPLIGLLYIFELPFLILGAYLLLRTSRKNAYFLLSWIIIAPIGSSLTFDDIPNLQRTLLLLPVLQLIIAYGLVSFNIFLKRKNFFLFLFTFFLIGMSLIYSFIFYLHQYYIHAPYYRPWIRQNGYEELVKTVNNLLPQYRKSIITDRESAPAIFFLFYSKYDPKLFQKETQHPAIKDFDRINFGKYIFSQEECPFKLIVKRDGSLINAEEKNILYVNSGLCDKDTSQNSKLIKTIKRSDNSIVFKLWLRSNIN